MLAFLSESLPWFVMRRWLYHLEKLADTALLAIALDALVRLAGYPLRISTAAMLAAALYFFGGKILWYTSDSYRRHRTHPGFPPVEWDWFSDAALSWFVVVMCGAIDHQFYGWLLTGIPPILYVTAVATRKTSP
jgi:hypothetical protein